jgi:hypothetical protein
MIPPKEFKITIKKGGIHPNFIKKQIWYQITKIVRVRKTKTFYLTFKSKLVKKGNITKNMVSSFHNNDKKNLFILFQIFIFEKCNKEAININNKF